MANLERTMKMKLLLAALFAALWTGTFAQQKLTPPKFNGADVEYFMRRLVGEFEKVAVERRIPAAEIPMRVAVAFKVDSTAASANGGSATTPPRGVTARIFRPPAKRPAGR